MDYHFSNRVSGLKPSAIREILKHTANPEVIPFAAGNPAADAFPKDIIKKISENILETDPIGALQYSVTEGYTPLRNRLKKELAAKNCFTEGRDDLIITSGAQQANELACKVLCSDGDTLICESPSFIGSLNAFKSYNVNIAGVELEDDGINIEKLEAAVKANKNVRLLYLIPNFQNPTGNTMSLEKRKAVYELAVKYDFIILEDNPYGDLRFSGTDIPSIKSFDTEGRVIYSRTFSKILAPGLRVGYVSAPSEIISKMIVCKQVADVHSNIWAQQICDRFMETTDMNAHLASLRKIYKAKYELMAAGIKEHFSEKVKVTKPEGGLFIWATLPEDTDMMSFCKKAVEEHKIAVVPGTAFMISENDKTSSFRMNFSTPADEQIVRGCEILGKLTQEL
ncbi:MAG: PLP-dependent aminotransferase family protein [Oscillospiraceae bacterium]|nr:PLP-dependent aminotransferase family protein [Oscillospiraceae bacterium]MDD6082546.1 PLP-dependent aminotransferase family protein [Oscillospiraceae bacterium]